MANSRSQLHMRIAFSLGLLIIGSIQFGLLLVNHFPIALALKDALISSVAMIVLAQILYLIQQNYHAARPLNFVNFAIVFVFTALFQLLFNGLFKLLFTYYEWHTYIFPYEAVRAIMAFFSLMLISFYWWIQKNEQTQQKIQQQLLDQERALTKAELDNIHQQLQPHFLFNSLNSIGALTVLDPTEAHRMIQLLSNFLRGTLRKDVQQLVPLEEEIQQLKLYLEIERVRFGNRLTTEINQFESCEDVKLPALILQPIIENAIKYGLYGQTTTILISVTISCEQQLLRIAVSSPYDAQFVAASAGNGFGLASIRKRLALFFGQNDLLSTSKTPEVFTTTLLIPQL